MISPGLFASFGVTATLAIASVVALSATLAGANAARVKAVANAHRAIPTDISAARRQHRSYSRYDRYNYGYSRRDPALNAYGSYGSSPMFAPYQGGSSGGFGYGYGDNSRNQTWD